MKKMLITLAIVLVIVSFNAGFIFDDSQDIKRANKIHEDALVFDAHAHPMIYFHATPEKLELGRKTGMSQMDFTTMKKGGLDAVFLSVPLVKDDSEARPTDKIIKNIRYILTQLRKYPDLAELALSAADVRSIHKAGKRAILLSIEDTNPLEGRIDSLKTYYDNGVRLITLSHTKIDPIAESDSDREGTKGLSKFGREVIKEMNRLGMVIDITHTGDSLQRAIIRESQAPVVASHSCARAIHDIPRNIPDDIMKDIARKGGAVMSTFYSGHLSSSYTAQRAEIQKVYDRKRQELEKKYKDNDEEFIKQLLTLEKKILPKRVEIDILMDHIDHTIRIAGIDHVGFGTDFGGIDNPVGLETAEGLPGITHNLLKRGYDKKGIQKFLGGNLIRVFEEVEKAAKKIK